MSERKLENLTISPRLQRVLEQLGSVAIFDKNAGYKKTGEGKKRGSRPSGA